MGNFGKPYTQGVYYATIGGDKDVVADLGGNANAIVAGTAGLIVLRPVGRGSDATKDITVYLAAGVPQEIAFEKIIASGTAAAGVTVLR